jgi:pimeloyl-ACP methyl ester carboxylesterase
MAGILVFVATSNPAARGVGYRVVAPDQRGYGLTDAPTAVEAYDILHLAGDLVGLVNALGEERAVIIGHDWGSVVAAATALLRPDLFRALGLLSVPYLLRRPIRPSARFHMATHERHFYQDYFQQPDHVEKELEADVRRTLLGVFYTASGDALTKLSSSSFVVFDKKTRLVDNLVLPEDLPAWLNEGDLDFFVEQFEKWLSRPDQLVSEYRPKLGNHTVPRRCQDPSANPFCHRLPRCSSENGGRGI